MGKSFFAALSIGIVLSTGTSCTPDELQQSQQNRQWEQGKTYGQWHLAFDGHGAVTGNDDSVTMYPKSAEDASVTHACLVHTDKEFGEKVDFEITVNTEEQVRKGEPNPWEVGWVLWNYEDNNRFYALALKPNGWELSKQDPAYPGAQRFLASGHEPTFALNQEHRVHVIHEGTTMRFFANGQQLGEFTDEESPYFGGAIGLYTEDARVTFTDLKTYN
ncbi:calcium-binding protein [Corynebacterium kalinowskii]|nr:calcium-binding protein [Corynebacterium kalinowskii]